MRQSDKTRSLSNLIHLTLGLLVVILLTSASTYLLFSSEEAPLNTLKVFVGLVNEGRCDSAYLLLSPELRDEVGRRDFKLSCERVERAKLLYARVKFIYNGMIARVYGALETIYWNEGCLYRCKMFGETVMIRHLSANTKRVQWLIQQLKLYRSVTLERLRCVDQSIYYPTD